MLITLSTAFFLVRTKKDVLPQFVYILPPCLSCFLIPFCGQNPRPDQRSNSAHVSDCCPSSDMVCSFDQAVSSSSCNIIEISAMFNLIFSQVYPGNKKLVSAAFNTTLPKIYAISMMYTLNSRRKLRYVAAQDVDTSGQLSGLRVCGSYFHYIFFNKLPP